MNCVALADITQDARSGFASGESVVDGVVQVRMNNITTDGALIWGKVRRVPASKRIRELLVKPGDILFNATNSPELVGKCALFDGYSEPVTFSNHFIRLRIDEDRAAPRYVIRYLQDRWSRRVFENMCKRWVNQASVGKEDLLSLKLPLPPLEEQQRIAAILDQADALRRLRQRAIDRLNTLGQAIFYEMFGDPFANLKSWDIGRLDDLVKDGDKINYGVVQPGEDLEDGVPLIRVADLLKPVIDVSAVKRIAPDIERNYKRSRVVGDEVLVACVGSIGVVALAHKGMNGANIARAVARIPIDSDKANRLFIAEQLKTKGIQRYFQSETRLVAQPTLNIKQLKETPVLLPPLEKQAKFANVFARLEEEAELHSAYISSLNRLFSSLQHSAFRGEL